MTSCFINDLSSSLIFLFLLSYRSILTMIRSRDLIEEVTEGSFYMSYTIRQRFCLIVLHTKSKDRTGRRLLLSFPSLREREEREEREASKVKERKEDNEEEWLSLHISLPLFPDSFLIKEQSMSQAVLVYRKVFRRWLIKCCCTSLWFSSFSMSMK